MDLVATLKEQHAAVQKLVGALDEAIGRGDDAKCRELMRTMGSALMGHLALEDRELYPGLVKFAEEQDDRHLATVARTFMENMARISGALVGFVERHSSGNVGLDRLRAEWPAVRQTLAQRIAAEETTLYPLFVRASKRAANLRGVRGDTAKLG